MLNHLSLPSVRGVSALVRAPCQRDVTANRCQPVDLTRAPTYGVGGRSCDVPQTARQVPVGHR